MTDQKEDGEGISSSYTEVVSGTPSPYSSTRITLSPRPGHRLVLVGCKLKALTPERNAVDKLAKRRASIAKTLPSSVRGRCLLSDHDRKLLTSWSILISKGNRTRIRSEYRVFDMAKFRVIDPAGKRHAAVWLVAQRVPCYLKVGGRTVSHSINSSNYWKKPFRTSNTFTGLQRVGKSAFVKLLFSIPNSANLNGLKLQFEDLKPVPLKVVPGPTFFSHIVGG